MENVSHTAKRLSIFTWHIHGSYLYYLSQGNFDIYIPVNEERSEGYYGRGNTFPFGENVIEVPAAEMKQLEFDCILFQTQQNYLFDQYEVLDEQQRRLPAIYLEHNAPAGRPADTLHILDNPEVILVHVTHYNKMMWHNQVPQVHVIEHGVTNHHQLYSGQREKGIVVINHIKERGRITGWDIYETVRKKIPLDLAGMGTEKYGGLGEVLHPFLPAFLSQYRFFFNPIRHTSFGLAVCEAMMAGLPIVAVATTEYVTTIQHGYSGFIHTNIDELVSGMQMLLDDHALAESMGRQSRAIAQQKFNIQRFTRDWEELFQLAIHQKKIPYAKEDSFYK